MSKNNPLNIKSKILSDGGLYHITVILEKTSKAIQLPSDQYFDLFISIGKLFSFDIQDNDGKKIPVLIKSYYDRIESFSYSTQNNSSDQNSKSLSFNMPFNWSVNYVKQIPIIHEVIVPKSFVELSQANGYKGTINGISLSSDTILIDDYSDDNNRIVCIVPNNDKLDQYARQIMRDSSTVEYHNRSNFAFFTLSPIEKPNFTLDIMSTNEKYLLQLSWDPVIIESGTPITFVMNLQDPSTGDLLRHSSFDLVLSKNGQEFYENALSSDL